ncbi:MAG: inositol monophosphatase [Methylococcaceae bacterium]|nr:inositol monophosphatase [Methylococcaceae bacterium]
MSDQFVEVEAKKAGASLASQVVTQVDRLAQDAILEILLPTCQRFDLALLTEETPDDLQRLEKDYFWCIDPLDGTLSFIESTPGYSVSIALVSRDGVSYIGVVFDPIKQTLYHAVKGGGVFKNNTPWLPQARLNQSLTIIFDPGFKLHEHYSTILLKLKKLSLDSGYQGFKSIFYGGSVMNACLVLENAPACYFKLPKPEKGGGCLWDYAATVCIFHELGALASDIHGKAIELNRPESTFLNHKGVLFTTDIQIARKLIDIELLGTK